MKKIVYLLITVLGITSAFAQTKASLEFKESKFSFGKIKQGVPVTHAFTFKNISDKPVVIESATASCGCTTPVYPKGAIAPGALDKVSVTYNAANMAGFTKPVTIKVANVQEPIIVTIEGEVVDAATADAAATTPAVAVPATTTDKVSTVATTSKTKMKATPAKTKVKSKS